MPFVANQHHFRYRIRIFINHRCDRLLRKFKYRAKREQAAGQDAATKIKRNITPDSNRIGLRGIIFNLLPIFRIRVLL